ncbi:hypothetical protein J6Q66_02790 [bacterium]|nr:hypothetical protein [bacterium]
MGNPAIGRKSDYWQLYAKDPKIREGAKQRFGVRPEGSEGGIQTTTEHGAINGGFNWHVLDNFDVGLNGHKQITAFSGGGNVTSNPFETSGTSPINPATQVASSGNQNLQQKLANIGTGELTPTCDAKHQWFA